MTPCRSAAEGPWPACQIEAGLLHVACSMHAAHKNTGALASCTRLQQPMQFLVGCTGCTVQHKSWQGLVTVHSSFLSAGADSAFKHAQRHGRLHGMYQSSAAGPDGKLPLREPPWPMIDVTSSCQTGAQLHHLAQGCAYPKVALSHVMPVHPQSRPGMFCRHDVKPVSQMARQPLVQRACLLLAGQPAHRQPASRH